MYTIELFKIYLFTYLNCVGFRAFLQNLVPEYKVPHFSSSFQPINGWNWESSGLTPEILIKLYSIKLIARLPKSSIFDVLIHIIFLESSLLISSGNSSFILNGMISIISFYIFKSLTYVFDK